MGRAYLLVPRSPGEASIPFGLFKARELGLLVRRTNHSLPDLYREDGIYGRWNWKALVALAAGVAVALIGLVVPGLRFLYDYAWFVGFAVAFALYWALMRGTPQVDLDGIDQSSAAGSLR